MRLLVVEDERDLAQVLVEALEEESYAVDLALTGEQADELFEVNDYDLVVLDWSIPPPTGIELLATWRAAGHQLPVLMLTGRREIEDRVGGLDSGADDYLTKPFSLVELLARVRSLMRRRDKSLVCLQAADLTLDRAAHTAHLGGVLLDLAPKEFGCLEYLLTHHDEVVSRTTLAEHVWDDSFDAMSNVIDVIIYRLRKKIDSGTERRLLHTVKGVGYLLKSERG